MAIRNLMFYKITFLCINLQYYKVYTETLIPKLIAHEFVNASLSANILKILEHYKQTDPVGLPIDAILDPCPIEDVSYLVAVQTLSMKNTRAHGFSRFRIVSVRIDLQALLVHAEITLEDLLIEGNYTLSSLFSKSVGPFGISLRNVTVNGNATLGVERDGHLRIKSVFMDILIKPQDMHFSFENLGPLARFFQDIINTAPNLIFDPIKPFMLRQANEKIRLEVNGNLAKVADDVHFPNSILALDMAISTLRKRIHYLGYDPYQLKRYNYTVGFISSQLRRTWIAGGASFYRTGDISLSLKKNKLRLDLQFGTQEVFGSTEWEIMVGSGIWSVSRSGLVKFSIEYIKVTLAISQALDTRMRPEINDLQFEIGNIQVRSDGAGTMDYFVEFISNVIPNLLRYQIMNALETPVKAMIQETMNIMNVEHLIKAKLREYERRGDVKFHTKKFQ